jgi:uncharacterized RDD family membrane protein YckC
MSSFERTSYSDQLNIDTPEQVELQFSIAGVGSRFVAALVDYLIQGLCLLLEFLFLVFLGSMAPEAHVSPGWSAMDTATKWVIAVIIFANFAFFAGYFTLFEAYWRGQTPGKKLMKLRVIKDSGRQITLFESLTRNVVRLIDYFPSWYLVGVVTILCNKANKRLGDFAAGTLVVHERLDEQSVLHQTSSRLITAPTSFAPSSWTPAQETLAPWAKPVTAMFPADAVARLSPQDLIVIESFFARMLDLPMETRAAVAYRMISQMAAKMGVPAPEGNPERALEAIAFQMRGSGRSF